MLKLSPNAIGMLVSKYSSVLKKMFLKNSVALVAGSLLFCASPAHAANYDVGAGKSYATLEVLRLAAANNPNFFRDGDTVTMYTGDTGSLINSLDFQDKSVTVRPGNSNVRFFDLNIQTAEIVNDSGVTVAGFNVTGDGGAVLLMESNLKVGDAEFSGNKASVSVSGSGSIDGGAVYLGNSSSFTADTAIFSDNYASAAWLK